MKNRTINKIITLAIVMICVSLVFVSCSTVKSFTVQFDTQGGTAVNDVVIDNDGDTYIGPVNPIKEGYVFIGWSNVLGTLDEWIYDSEKFVSGGKITVYAIWEKAVDALEFSVDFILNGGAPEEAVQIIENGGKILKPIDPVKKGYTFDCWKQNDVEYDFNMAVKGDCVLSANWVANKYLIRYNSNILNSTGSMVDSSHVYDSEQALTLNTYTLLNYTFSHWNTKADGTGKSHLDEEIVENITTENNKIIDLYAIWGDNFNYKLKSDNTYELVGLNESGMTEIIIPTRHNQIPVTSIGKHAFTGQTKIRNIQIPSGIIQIGERAFYDCDNLESIFIPKSVEFIDAMPFGNCNKLVIYAEVTSAPTEWEYGWNFSESLVPRPVHWGASLNEIIVHEDSRYIIIDGNALLTQYLGTDTNYEVKSSVNYNNVDYDIIAVGERAFENKRLQSIAFSNSIQRIERKAFEGNIDLYDISLPDNLDVIGADAFNNTGWYLSQVKGIVYLKDWALDFKGVMLPNTTVEVKNGIKKIADFALYGSNDNLLSIMLPDGLLSIGDGAFYGCVKLDNIIVPNSVISIGAEAFYACRGMKFISLGSGLITLGDSVFENCSSMDGVQLPAGLLSIGESAFASCSSLTSISVPNKITIINDTTFSACAKLNEIELPKDLSYIGNMAFQGTAITELIIPKSVQYIGQMAFWNCANMSIYFESNSPSDKWNSMWDYLAPPSIYWYTSSQPSTDGKYWHYVNGIVEKW